MVVMKEVILVYFIYPLLLLMFLLVLISCSSYIKQPVASHVLAVTLQGDTILVAIDKIRPNQYQFYYPLYSQPYYRPYYYNRYDYQWRYPDNRGTSSSNNSNNNSNNSASVNSAPDIVTRPSSDVLMKNKN
jgi:hypothetical protein|tara:strand:+ start:131 stop:523 length:393 start_codon:yes stop_codon:yes gene_type:complete